MATLLYKNNYPPGTKNSIQYFWGFGKFEIRTYETNCTVMDSDIEKREGKSYFNPSKRNSKCTSIEIEIPENVIERKDALNLDLKLRKESISSVDHKAGKIYFSLNEEGQVIAKLGDKEAVADNIETIENKKVIDVRSLDLEFPFLEVPAAVEAAFLKAKNIKIMQNCKLIDAGKSVLTGQNYFKLNFEIPASSWDCIADLFENFGSGSGRTGELKGWLTSMPEKVEAALGIKDAVSDRKKEIDLRNDDVKKFEAAIATIEK